MKSVKDLQAIYSKLEEYRNLFIPKYEEISKYTHPISGKFPSDDPEHINNIDYTKYIDTTTSRAINILAAGLQSGMTSPSRSWFNLGYGIGKTKTYEVSLWLDVVKNLFENVLRASNIYKCLHQIYVESSVYGTGCLLVERDFKNVIIGTTFTVGEYVLGITKGPGIDTFGRDFTKTVGELVSEFGIENVKPETKEEYNLGHLDKKIHVIHMIFPNTDRDPYKLDNTNMPFASVYWEHGAETPLRSSGYKQFPVLTPRWSIKTVNDIYGIGIGEDILGDAKMLQRLWRDKLLGIKRAVDPPMQQSSAMQGKPNLNPHAINRYSGTGSPALSPVYNGNINLQPTEEAIRSTQIRIQQQFYTDVFSMLQNITQEKTAREVEELHSEKLLILGPIYEIFKDELLDKLINLIFQYSLDAGIIPDPPAEMQGGDIDIEYISMVAQAQKMSGLTALKEYVSFVMGLAQVVPSIVDNMDFDTLARIVADMLGVPTKVLASSATVQALRQQRAQAQQQQAQQQQTAEQIKIAKDASKIEMDNNTGLDKILSAAQGSPV